MRALLNAIVCNNNLKLSEETEADKENYFAAMLITILVSFFKQTKRHGAVYQ